MSPHIYRTVEQLTQLRSNTTELFKVEDRVIVVTHVSGYTYALAQEPDTARRVEDVGWYLGVGRAGEGRYTLTRWEQDESYAWEPSDPIIYPTLAEALEAAVTAIVGQ